MSDLLDPAAAGRSAISARRWREGYDLLATAAARGELPPEDLELLAWSAYLTDEVLQVVPILERAYAGYVAAANNERAAAVAVQLAHEYGSVRSQKAIGSGWLARAERLLDGEPEGIAHGYLALERGLGAVRAHDYESARELGATAERIGHEHGDMGLELRGRQRRAVSLIHLGEVEEGRLLLNEVNAAAYGGTLKPYETVVLYCNAIGTCRDVAAFDEASQWTERAELFCDENAISAFPGVCRINRAELMRYEGKLEDAEKAASEATQMLATWAPRIAAAGYAEVGEVRLRLGDLAKAEEAFDQADELGHDPEPGRSLLLLTREKPAAALASIRRALGDDLPPLARARLLPGFVEIATAAGAVDDAAAAAEELTETATRYDAPALHAAAAVAAGSVALARDEAQGAVRPLRRALRLWQETNARYEAARTRVLLARAYAATGDAEGAMHELAQAGSVFDQLGCAPRRREGRRAARPRRRHTRDDDLRLHRHRRLDAPRRAPRRRELAEAAPASRRADPPGDGGRGRLASSTTPATGSSSPSRPPTAPSPQPSRSSGKRPATCPSRSASASTPQRRRASATTTAARACTSPPASRALGRGEEIVASRETVAGAHRSPHERAEERAVEGHRGAGRGRLDRLARRELGARRTLRRARPARRPSRRRS